MSFKVRLLLGATAPFAFALPAVAQVTIGTATTTPVETATADNGAPADVTINTGGSVTVTGDNSTAVTINSSNDVINSGTISITDANNATGVRILPGFTGSYTGNNSASISVVESYVRPDTDSDGDLDGPLAIGTGRVGILLDQGGTFTGDILINGTASPFSGILVEGNNSFGVSLRSVLDGNYRQDGSVSVIGSNDIAIDIRENITGDVKIGGPPLGDGSRSVVSATGEGSSAVSVLGDIGGEFLVSGAITSTGFAQGGLSNYEDPDTASTTDNFEPAALDPDDLLIGGPTVVIRGNLAKGLLVNGAAVGTTDPTDDIKDVIQDFNPNRTTGSISILGSAPALLVQSVDGAAGDAIVFGNVTETIRDGLDDDGDGDLNEIIGTFNYNFGLINRGSITSNGVNIGIGSNAVTIAGSADGTHTTTIDGGIFNGGVITAQAFEADATGLILGAGASTPNLSNIGTIRGDVNTETTHDAYGVRVLAGANLPSVTNGGLIAGATRGWDGDAIAFQDLSGTVTNFTNNSRIGGFHIDDDVNDDILSGSGAEIGLDLSHSAQGVTFTQTDIIDNALVLGDIRLGVGSDTVNLLSGQIIGDIDFGAGGSDTLNVNSATLTGASTFSGSAANILFNSGAVTGDIALGAATGSMALSNLSTFNGAITRTGAGAFSVNVDNSTFNDTSPTALALSSFTAANNANIGIVINNARIANNTPMFNVSGTASIDGTSKFTPIFQQFANQPFTLRVLNAGTLTLGGSLDDLLTDGGPFLYNMQLLQPNPNAIDLSLTVKTASELGLNTRQSGAYGAVLDLMTQDDTIAAAIASVSTANDFRRGWSDLLPSSDVAVMQVLAANASAAFGATANRLDMMSEKPDAPGGAWTEEFGVFHKADASADSVEVSGGGFGVAAGVDLISDSSTLIGAYVSLESAELEEEQRTGAPLNVSQTSIGGYAGWTNGGLALNAAASYGFVDFTSERRVEIGSLQDRLKASWSGSSYTAAARASYTLPLGWLSVKPFAGVDYVGFNQDGYTETALTTDGLALVAGDADASLATASAGLQLIGNLGSDDAYSIRPSLSLGYRSILSWDSSPAALRFAGSSANTSFSLASGLEPEDAITAGLGLNLDSQFVNIKLGYDAQISDTSTTHYGSITFRLAFW